jgi:hypothetical protein
MSRYAITITLPNGKWRIRRQTAAEVQEISRHILQSVSDRVKVVDLQKLWPSESIARWHQFGDDVFDAVCSGVAQAIEWGRVNILQTGQDLLQYANTFLQARGWKEIQWSSIAKHLLKVLLSAVIGWLRVQFPVINAGNAGQAVKVLAGLAGQRGR